MEHIDGAKLNSDVHYRFEYLSKFLNFGAADIQAINGAAPKLAPLVPAVVDSVYDKLFSFDVTKEKFVKNKYHFTGETANPPGSMNLTPERVSALKESLNKYLVKVVSQAQWDNAFLDYLSNLGKVHANKGEGKNIDISYIHMNATMGLVEHKLIDAVLNQDLGLDAKGKSNVVLALNKFFWIQNDLFTMHYVPV